MDKAFTQLFSHHYYSLFQFCLQLHFQYYLDQRGRKFSSFLLLTLFAIVHVSSRLVIAIKLVHLDPELLHLQVVKRCFIGLLQKHYY